jgi:hypothetical protein
VQKRKALILQSEVRRAIKEMWDKKTTRDENAPVDGLKIWKKMVSE